MTTSSSSFKEKAFEPESPFSISRSAATIFAEKWKDIISEQQNDQAFWQDFFRDLLGITDLQAVGIEFQKKVRSSKKDTVTRIDVYWKDTFLVEHKSAGKDLDAAEDQAREYVFSLPPAQRPPIVIVCDFARFRIVDYVLNKSNEFRLEDLADNLDRIEAIVSHKTNVATTVQVEADQKAAQLMADLYVQLEKYGYEGHEASVFMVRILFCLFADDTRMWKSGIFQELVKDTNEQGSDLGPRLSTLFTVLDTPKDQRKGPQDAFLADFPYVNGGIFSERLETIHFNQPMRQALINACNYDWSSINPTIFGALFQDIKSKEARRANGEHYTTEENIDKVIGPIFINELQEKLESAWDNSSKLKELQRELGSFQILDPACGCGNFLITTYKRLRQLELEIIVRVKQLDGTAGQTSLFDVTDDIHVKLEQLHGIEYVEWSSQIAKVAIYLTDHQENMKLEAVLGVAPNRFPLSHSANIVLGNALLIDWAEVCPMSSKTLVIGNPPFLGQHLQNAEQKEDTKRIWHGNSKTGVMDYVSNWFVLASEHVERSNCKAAFVATNSIAQGEQPSVLWKELWKHGVNIGFAHQSFAWSNDSGSKAAVHCVIIGIEKRSKASSKNLFLYASPKSAPKLERVENITPYLTSGPDVVVETSQSPKSKLLPKMLWGSKPTDSGHLSNIKPQEALDIRQNDQIASLFLRRIIGAEELINGGERYCLWLEDASPSQLKQSPVLRQKIELVRRMRSESKAPITQKNAQIPHLFVQRAQPAKDYIGVPLVSSESREYIPLDWVSQEVIASNALATIPDGELWHFALLSSSLFNSWARVVSGRLESRIRLSAEITYNNLPIPIGILEKKVELEQAAEEILASRKRYPDSTLGDLYDPKTMPLDLRKAHQKNDRLVLSCFALQSSADSDQILNKLFKMYAENA